MFDFNANEDSVRLPGFDSGDFAEPMDVRRLPEASSAGRSTGRRTAVRGVRKPNTLVSIVRGRSTEMPACTRCGRSRALLAQPPRLRRASSWAAGNRSFPGLPS
jgi:hypothetical protein